MRKHSVVMTAVLFFVSAAVSPARADDISELKAMIQEMKHDYETRIRALQQRIEELEARQAQTRPLKEQIVEEVKADLQQEEPFVEYVGRGGGPVGRGGVHVHNPFGFGDVTLGGYFDMEYHDFTDKESTFKQHRWIINIGAVLNDRLRFNSEYEIEYGGPDAAGGDGEAKVEQAYVDYLINDAVNLRTGALLIPLGRYNLYHDSDLQDLTDRPIMAKDIVPTTWSEAGVGLFGELEPFGEGALEDWTLSYELYAINGLNAGFSDTGLSGARGSLKIDNNDNKAVVGRLTVSPALNHEFSLSGYRGRFDGDDDVLSGTAFDTFHRFGPFELIGEYAYWYVDEMSRADRDLPNRLQGGYVQVGYDFWPAFLDDTVLGRSFENPTFTLVGRYGWAEITDDGDVGSGDNEETRITLGFNYRPMDFFVFKFEYQINRATNEPLEHGDADGFVASVAMGF